MVTQQYPQRYRWDFIGLSTDTKPTPETSERVVNGSTFYCSDNSKLYVFCDGTWYERKPLGGGGGGTEYTAGDGINISDQDVISVDTTAIQPKLTAGSNITISDDTISATDTTYSSFTGTDGTAAGTAGLVPAPATTDADKFLKSDGTWATAGGGGSSVTVVQTAGTSTENVMSQNATTSMVFGDPAHQQLVRIGTGATAGNWQTSSDGRIAIGYGSTATGFRNNIAIGNYAKATSVANPSIGIGASAAKNYTIVIGGTSYNQDGERNIMIGFDSKVDGGYRANCVALGYSATCSRSGEVNIGAGSSGYGYNSTNYRVLGGVHDGQDAHDVTTVGQINGLIDAINTALNTNISHIGS